MLNAQITADIADAFDNDLADAVKSVDYIAITQGEYDTVSRTTGPDTEVISDWRVVRYDYSRHEIAVSGSSANVPLGEDIRVGDTRFLGLQAELNITPKIDDFILYRGERYIIITTTDDPADVIWILQGRKV